MSYRGSDSIRELCLAETSKDPVEIINKMMRMEFCHMHGTGDLSAYERIGIASGVAFGKYYPEMLAYLSEHLPEDKKVFFIHTAGKPEEKQCAAAKEIAGSRHCGCLGVFCCKGYDTYGPFKLIGGLNRSHPDAEDIAAVKRFYAGL